jgi:UDP-N-acetyl-D-glucosamine dehydrogenase
MQSPILRPATKSFLLNKIETRTAHVCILGLGYVGLPLAVQFARSGFPVTGFEVDEVKIAKLNSGISYIQDVPSADLSDLIETEAFRSTTDFTRLRDADVVIVCVPTPLDKMKKPDISYILSAAESICNSLHPGQLIVLESTTYPGTTDEILLKLFQEAGYELDRDFFLAFSPERVDPGNPTFRTENIPKLVGGVSPDSTEVAAALYRTVVSSVHPVSSARAAEAAKLLENTFRSVNIALVNEMAQLCRILGIDIWEVVEAAGTKPFGFMKFFPGPGIGGHCIPLDPHYLTWKARAHGFEPRFIELAEEVNTHMPDYVIELVNEALNSQHKCINSADILVLGVAYKPDIDDYRESPALRVMQKLHKRGAKLRYSDPHISTLPFFAGNESYILQSQELSPESISRADCVLIITDHRAFDWQIISQHAHLVVDTRNAMAAYRHACPIFHI